MPNSGLLVFLRYYVDRALTISTPRMHNFADRSALGKSPRRPSSDDFLSVAGVFFVDLKEGFKDAVSADNIIAILLLPSSDEMLPLHRKQRRRSEPSSRVEYRKNRRTFQTARRSRYQPRCHIIVSVVLPCAFGRCRSNKEFAKAVRSRRLFLILVQYDSRHLTN